jgi:hypothetical protein
MTLPAETFNQEAEKYYRTVLRKQHIGESFDLFSKDIIKLDRAESGISHEMRSLLHGILQEKNLPSFLERVQSEMIQEEATPETLEKLVYLILAYIFYKDNFYSKFQEYHHRETTYEEAENKLPHYPHDGQTLPAKSHQKGISATMRPHNEASIY